MPEQSKIDALTPPAKKPKSAAAPRASQYSTVDIADLGAEGGAPQLLSCATETSLVERFLLLGLYLFAITAISVLICPRCALASASTLSARGSLMLNTNISQGHGR